MIEVVGISFENEKKIYYFKPNDLKLKKNITVIVKTNRGTQFGQIVLPNFNITKKRIEEELKSVIRMASKGDYTQHVKNKESAQLALATCREYIKANNLKMQLIDCSFTFDKSQLLFRFTSDTRVDFRELARELASKYKTRIELRQIGVRDKAKEIGGCGFCGRQLCCSRFNSSDFETVSINMAKNQNLSLNPSKINGVCGRLLCCLRYENEDYKQVRKELPCMGCPVKTEKGTGKVVALNLIKKHYTVRIPDVGVIEIDGNN